MTLLRARQLSLSFGRHTVLHDIDLPDIGAGRVVGLIGPNGSGKSTLLRALSGELKAGGEISIEGEAATQGKYRSQTNGVFYLPQSLPQPSTLLAFELLTAHAEASGLLSKQNIARRVRAAFDWLGILDLALRPMSELSGGNRQLVGLALALVHRPRLLLLDEPTSALDLVWQGRLLQSVKRYAAEYSGAAIVALHDLSLAARHCDEVLLLSQGRLISSGVPSSVLNAHNIRDVYGVDACVEQRASGGLIIEVMD